MIIDGYGDYKLGDKLATKLGFAAPSTTVRPGAFKGTVYLAKDELWVKDGHVQLSVKLFVESDKQIVGIEVVGQGLSLGDCEEVKDMLSSRYSALGFADVQEDSQSFRVAKDEKGNTVRFQVYEGYLIIRYETQAFTLGEYHDYESLRNATLKKL